MPSETELFTLGEKKWYAWQMLPGYGAPGHYYSPIRISRIKPKKRGDGTLRLEFYNAGYAEGVRDFHLELGVLIRAKDYMIAVIDRGQSHPDTRSAIIGPINMNWLDKHLPDFIRRNPPTESERRSGDASDFLDGLMGTGDI